MKRSFKTLAACAAFAVCMSAMMIVSFAATDLKIDPVALIGYSQDAASESGAAVPGGELFIGLDAGSYTFADVAESLNDYGLQYEAADEAEGAAYVIGGAIRLGIAGAFADPLSAAAAYSYSIVGDGYQPIIVTIATKNAEEVVSVVIDGVSGVVGNGLPEIPSDVTDTLDDIYTGVVGAVPDYIASLQDAGPGIVSDIIGDISGTYSDVIEGAVNALEEGSVEIDQDYVGSVIDEVAGTVGTVFDNYGDVIADAAAAAQDTLASYDFGDLLAALFS